MQIKFGDGASLDKIPERDALQSRWNCFAKRWSLYRLFRLRRLA